MLDQHRQAFKEEASELIVELESGLLELENRPHDQDLIAKIFRAMHTIKGSSGMFGFDDIAMFTHDIESIYDHIRSGRLEASKEIIDLTLKSLDYIRAMLDDDGGKKFAGQPETLYLLQAFRSLAGGVRQPDNQKKQNETQAAKPAGKQTQILSIFFKPAEDIFLSGTNPVSLLKELAGTGELKAVGRFNSIPDLASFNPEKCYISWLMLLCTQKSIDSIKDIFIFVEDDSILSIGLVNQEGINLTGDETAEYFRSLDDETVPDLQKMQAAYRQILAKRVKEHAAAKEPEKTKVLHETEVSTSLRVNAEKIDHLVNLVGELVTLQAQLTQAANSSSNSVLLAIAESVERITWDLRDSALNIRMLPIGTTFAKFNRLIRDLSKELGKEVDLITEGAETELDKTVLEKISDPLIHLLRNSLDHGIETPDIRQAAGKDRKGKIMLKAFQAGGSVVIQIIDDGAGIDREALLAKAVNLGLVSPEAALTDAEIFNLMFSSGLSTARQVTNVSGRGVGMDVVKKAIENLRGNTEVRSEKGKGTTISLKIPLTLAIIDGLQVKVGPEFYILPLSSVEECIELTKKDVAISHGRNLVKIRGEIVPYIRLRDFFTVEGERPEIEQVVIVEVNGIRIGFVVDSVVGQHQTVLKSLGALYKNIDGIGGATILGDGRIALTLDIQKLAELQEIEEKSFSIK